MAYKNKEDNRAAQARYREKNREKIREQQRLSYQANPEAYRERTRKSKKKYRDNNPASCKQLARDQWRRLRHSIIEYLGGKCVKCAFSDSCSYKFTLV